MKKITLAMLLLTSFGFVQAAELEDAQKLWDDKQFYKAFQIFNKLAHEGNFSAQWQLGEMYGFGEGTVEDADKAEFWLKQAAAKGSAEAATSLAAVKQRQAHRADIAYYTTSFDGANAAYAKFGCTRPAIPARSTTNEEIAAVNASIGAWTQCYDRFVSNLRNVAPPEKTISSSILPLMNNEEFKKSSVLISKVYENIWNNAKQIEKGVAEESNSWKAATEKFASDNNSVAKEIKVNTENEMQRVSRLQSELITRKQVLAVGMNK
ncbi:sel1 repeat family protein [Janthinobacterium psychrotolerans]|uniref:Sel1 repeat-containing protein n=1 Tax=Janthinobacterium psychrotolerans TaxID=1747903 RepID=A0A1A7C4M0_9BURK|nr:sel1 repeat family protein [Janthinobacterium psychrotolerans]OBV39999.1 Sel1 repeat-containing protein [Janthinobacterium psychrotolerans]